MVDFCESKLQRQTHYLTGLKIITAIKNVTAKGCLIKRFITMVPGLCHKSLWSQTMEGDQGCAQNRAGDYK
jgi:hypothetical protein